MSSSKVSCYSNRRKVNEHFTLQNYACLCSKQLLSNSPMSSKHLKRKNSLLIVGAGIPPTFPTPSSFQLTLSPNRYSKFSGRMRWNNVLSDEDDLGNIWCPVLQCWRIARVLSGIQHPAQDAWPFTSKSLFLIQYRLQAAKRACFLTLVRWPVLNWMLIWVQLPTKVSGGHSLWPTLASKNVLKGWWG